MHFPTPSPTLSLTSLSSCIASPFHYLEKKKPHRWLRDYQAGGRWSEAGPRGCVSLGKRLLDQISQMGGGSKGCSRRLHHDYPGGDASWAGLYFPRAIKEAVSGRGAPPGHLRGGPTTY